MVIVSTSRSRLFAIFAEFRRRLRADLRNKLAVRVHMLQEREKALVGILLSGEGDVLRLMYIG